MNPLIEFHLRFWLSERIVIRFEFDRSVFPGRGACRGDCRRACRLADVLEDRPYEGASVTKAMIFISAPQYRQVRGKTSNKRAMSVAHR